MRVFLFYQLSWLLVYGHPCLFPDVDSCRVISIITQLIYMKSDSIKFHKLDATLSDTDSCRCPCIPKCCPEGHILEEYAGTPDKTDKEWHRHGFRCRLDSSGNTSLPMVPLRNSSNIYINFQSSALFIDCFHDLKANLCKSSTRQAWT